MRSRWCWRDDCSCDESIVSDATMCRLGAQRMRRMVWRWAVGGWSWRRDVCMSRSRITDACAPNATDDWGGMGVGYHENSRWRIVAGEEMGWDGMCGGRE